MCGEKEGGTKENEQPFGADRELHVVFATKAGRSRLPIRMFELLDLRRDSRSFLICIHKLCDVYSMYLGGVGLPRIWLAELGACPLPVGLACTGTSFVSDRPKSSNVALKVVFDL